MRAAAMVLALTVSLAGCGQEPCHGGKVPIALVTPAAGLGTSALPPEFDFSEQELVAAIQGTWTDAAAGVVLTVEPEAGGQIGYAIPGGEGFMCGLDAWLPIVGEISVAGVTGAVTGIFLVSGSEITRGGLELRNDAGEITCFFEYYSTDGSPILDGSCGPPLVSQTGRLVLARGGQG